MIETLLQSMGVKASDFQEVVSLAKDLDTRLTVIERSLLRVEGVQAKIVWCLQEIQRNLSTHPNSPTCAVPGGKTSG